MGGCKLGLEQERSSATPGGGGGGHEEHRQGGCVQRSGKELTGSSPISEALNARLRLQFIHKKTGSSRRVPVDLSRVLSGRRAQTAGEQNEGDRLEGIRNGPGRGRAGLS